AEPLVGAEDLGHGVPLPRGLILTRPHRPHRISPGPPMTPHILARTPLCLPTFGDLDSPRSSSSRWSRGSCTPSLCPTRARLPVSRRPPLNRPLRVIARGGPPQLYSPHRRARRSGPRGPRARVGDVREVLETLLPVLDDAPREAGYGAELAPAPRLPHDGARPAARLHGRAVHLLVWRTR